METIFYPVVVLLVLFLISAIKVKDMSGWVFRLGPDLSERSGPGFCHPPG